MPQNPIGGVAPKPLSGTPAGHSITFNPNLYVHLLCPREMGNAHFSNVKPVLVKHSEIYKLPSERKTNTNLI